MLTSAYFRTGFNAVATFAMTKNDKFKLVHKGYEYHKHHKDGNGISTRWRCSSYYKSHCMASVHTRQIKGNQMMKVIRGDHNHLPKSLRMWRHQFQTENLHWRIIYSISLLKIIKILNLHANKCLPPVFYIISTWTTF